MSSLWGSKKPEPKQEDEPPKKDYSYAKDYSKKIETLEQNVETSAKTFASFEQKLTTVITSISKLEQAQKEQNQKQSELNQKFLEQITSLQQKTANEAKQSETRAETLAKAIEKNLDHQKRSEEQYSKQMEQYSKQIEQILKTLETLKQEISTQSKDKALIQTRISSIEADALEHKKIIVSVVYDEDDSDFSFVIAQLNDLLAKDMIKLVLKKQALHGDIVLYFVSLSSDRLQENFNKEKFNVIRTVTRMCQIVVFRWALSTTSFSSAKFPDDLVVAQFLYGNTKANTPGLLLCKKGSNSLEDINQSNLEWLRDCLKNTKK